MICRIRTVIIGLLGPDSKKYARIRNTTGREQAN